MQTLNATSDPEGSQHLTPSRFIWGLALVAVLVISALVVATTVQWRQAQALALRPDLQIEMLRGNVDTRLRRLADGVGAHAVIVPKDKSATLTPVVRKVACGAAEVIPLVAVTNLARSLEKLQQRGLWVVGTAGEAEVSIYDQDLTGPTILIMGAEGKGMRRLTREHCDYLVNLPMAGSVSSLNVSVATGVCLFEAQRQRGAKAKAAAKKK